MYFVFASRSFSDLSLIYAPVGTSELSVYRCYIEMKIKHYNTAKAIPFGLTIDSVSSHTLTSSKLF